MRLKNLDLYGIFNPNWLLPWFPMLACFEKESGMKWQHICPDKTSKEHNCQLLDAYFFKHILPE